MKKFISCFMLIIFSLAFFYIVSHHSGDYFATNGDVVTGFYLIPAILIAGLYGYEEYNDKNIILHFEVLDTGIGIKEEDLQRLYSPFERIDEIRNRTIEGTGLGMSIVKKLLAMMDTKLEVESKYGLGSIFSFGVKQQVVSREPIGDFKEKYREYLDSVEKYHESFQAPQAQILVVDDTQMNLTVIKSLLKQTKIQIITAESGKETLDLVTKQHFDVIFLDHRMPEMDGIETFEAMKVLPDNLNKDVPVIALTANAISGAREEYMEHGFTDYISKPVNGIQLEQMLLHYLPVEKILSVSINNGEDNYKSEFAKVVPSDSSFHKLKGVDIEVGINNCGDVETYENVVTDFYNSIDRNADAIEGYLRENDIRNFTVLVHALKSFMVNSIIKELSERGFDIIQTEASVDALKKIEEKTTVFLLYIDDMEDMRDFLVYLNDKTVEGEISLSVIGSKDDMDTLEESIPGRRYAASFVRPINVKELATKMEQVLKDEDIRKQKKRILIVDDDGTMLRTIKSWLDEDYYVFMVNSGVAAITFLATNEVDLILLDYEMPITTGPQVLEMLRSEKKTSKIPVIFLTNKRDKESVMNVLDLKPEGYLLKTRGKFALLTQLSEFFEKEKAKDY